MNTLIKLSRLFVFVFLFPIVVFGQVKLPKLVSDGMVLQRNAEVKIWGWASANEAVTVSFNGLVYKTVANTNGDWMVKLPRQKAGGPYSMTITASNTLTLKDIMVGDVWVCSGQSNMELPMYRVRPLYEKEIAEAKNSNIRYFNVPQTYNFNQPQKDLPYGKWVTADPQSVLSFSAVGYFFASELYQKYHIPIGLINTSLGGSPAEAWVSEDALKAFPDYWKEAQRFKDTSVIIGLENDYKTKSTAWFRQLQQNDDGYKDPQNPWYSTSVSTSDWNMMKVPGYWSATEIGNSGGVVWFRREIDIPASMTGCPAKLNLGRIVDADSVFINGVFAATTSYQYPPRWYNLPAGMFKPGKNIITVRIISPNSAGGFVPDKKYFLSANGESIDLTGTWQYRLGTKMGPAPNQPFVRWKPLGLYNAMIEPLINYRIKGVIWYQGEANTWKSKEYQKLFPAMIENWRDKWGQGNFPFLFVQLANFMEPKNQPSESNWALLRESQLKTLSVPNTAMAVTIDLGEWNDIHPLNKKDVGKRLAFAAQKMAYDDSKIVYSGPLYVGMKVADNKIILSFKNTGSGLVTKSGGELKYFAIAGADKKFVFAKAIIRNNTVEVWSDSVPHPVAVRYAWADNPEGANLYNREGLPASPFRTDEW
ncbi:MAG: sialate O-acetylesterase [Bacteroidota bacterium]|nr:sialate O-acetylesterase [Bacteroidota bacterium]